ncbi:MAG: LPS-assembly protein LptD [Methylobacter sp.]|nr:LPS-assembly protein LptD [Methylobacter sp.]
MIHYATKLIPSMRRRLFLLFLPSIYAPVSIANEALWNCAQNKDNKEWVCVGEKKTADKASVVKAPAKVQEESSVKGEQSAPVEAVDQSAGSGLARKAPEGARAGTASDENTQPTVSKPERAMAQPSPTENAVIESSTTDKLPVSTKKDKRKVTVASKSVAQSPVDSDATKLLQTETNRPGWSCDAKAADKNWNCKLVGADPKGQARIMASYEPGASLLTPAFDYNEEQTFSNLKSQLKYDPWQNCAAPKGTKPSFVPGKDLREETPLDINSDYAEILDNEIYSYNGNVEMTRADQHSVSKKATYDNVSETLDLQGSVYYNEDELALHSESASLNLASDQIKLRDALFISPAAPLRGRAKTIYRENASLTRYKAVAYTSCRPGNQDWVVHATELKMNKTTGQGAAKNAWLEFKGNPVFYTPYLSFPIDNRRLTGFLAPSFGHTQRGGFSLAVPFYWNIAPNYDATIRPRYLANRGAILGGGFRYLTEMSKGTNNFEFMPNDSLLNKPRYMAALKNDTQFTTHIRSNFDLNYASDKDYFSDLGNALSTSTYSSYLISQANLGYLNKGVSLRGHVDSYQSINKAVTSAGLPYRRLPQVNLNLKHSFDFMPLDTSMDAEYVYFQHSTLTNAQRTNAKPSVSFPMKSPGAFLIPKASLQHTDYVITSQGAGLDPACLFNTTIQCLNNSSGGVRAYNNISRTLPIFSADSGLYMEKNLDFSNRAYLHTLEPRLFYLYIPNTNQQDIPIFDTALNDFSFNSMFLENRFSGIDRVQDANQVTAALTTRLIDAKSGKEKLKLSVGEIAYFRAREVTLPGYPVETDKLSNLVTELNAELTDHISLTSGVQYNPYLNNVPRHSAALHYLNKPDANKPGEIFNLGYRYRKNIIIPTAPGTRPYDIFQTDVSIHWPVYKEWSAVGRWTYSILNKATQESFIGVEKENCCWTFRFIGRRWINGISLTANNPNLPSNPFVVDATGVPQTGVFFEIELKGLTGVGEKLDQFFDQQIYGYRKAKQ